MSGVEITQVELLPCPFCGGDPITEFACTPDGDGAYFAHCQHESCPAWPNTQGETEAEAIAAWNTRQSATAPLIAALERVAHETRRQQLPITALVHEIAQEALAKHKGNSDGQG